MGKGELTAAQGTRSGKSYAFQKKGITNEYGIRPPKHCRTN